MGNFTLDIIVITKDRYIQLSDCVNHILRNNLAVTNFIIIDGGEKKDSSFEKKTRYLLKSQKIKFIYCKVPHKGIAYSRNVGLANVKSKYFAFVDDDEYVPVNWVSNVKKIFEKMSDLDVLCGPKIPKHKENYWNKIWTAISINEFNYQGVVYSIPAGNSIYRSSFIKKNKLKFDERLKYSSEDHALSKMLVEAEANMYFDKRIYVNHDYRIDFWGFVKQWFYYGWGKNTYHSTLLNKNVWKPFFYIRKFLSTFPYKASLTNVSVIPGLILLNIVFFCGYIYGYVTQKN